MANKAAKKSSRAFVWAILGLLVLAMAGFGIGGFGGTVNSIGRVGKTEIGTDQYASTLQNLVQQQSQAFGQPLTIQQAFQIGLDARARQLVVEGAALTEETRVAGLSVGDAIVAREIQNNPAFQGASGFNRENYRLSLERSGLTQRGYEDRLREQLSRDLLQQAVVGGLNQEDGFADIMYDFIGEQRSFRWAPVPESLLVGATPAPTQAELEAFYDESGAQFTRPEIRNITYAWLSPEQMLDQIEVPEEDLQEAYESRINEFVRPERRLIEQLSFPDTAAAADAKAQIEAGEATFEELVEARGLTLEDVDQGDVTLASLGGSVGETVFALEQPGIAGPVETSLGPALVRVNAILAATETTFEEAREILLEDTSADRARREISNMVTDLDDLLVGGATLEELANETDMELGTIEFSVESEGGIAGYNEFRSAAQNANDGDFPELVELSDGGVFALRLDSIVEPAIPPLADITDQATEAYIAAKTVERREELAASLLTQIKQGVDMEALGLTPNSETNLTRTSFVDAAPLTMVSEVFELNANQLAQVSDGGDVVLVELLDISAADREAPEATALVNQLRQQAELGLAQDIFSRFGQAVQSRHGLELDQGAINLVNQSFTQTGGHY